MKAATGSYVLVRVITKGKAINLANELFGAEADKLWAEADKLWAEADKLWAEGTKLRAELAIQQCAYIPDQRAMNFIAADRKDGVYCFVWNRKEIWFYNGEDCPDPDTVEVVWKEKETDNV